MRNLGFDFSRKERKEHKGDVEAAADRREIWVVMYTIRGKMHSIIWIGLMVQYAHTKGRFYGEREKLHLLNSK